MLTGSVEMLWLPDGERMQAVTGFSFTDRAGRVWPVHAGFVTDGASIPRELWGVIGAPFNGDYRIAAVLHDSAYGALGVAKLDADLMLHEASLFFGCAKWLADALYAGVRLGGMSAYVADQRDAAEHLQADADLRAGGG